MDQAKAGFLATVSLRAEPRILKGTGNAREDFWRPIQEQLRGQNLEIEGIAPLEEALVANFGIALHQLLMAHFETPGQVQVPGARFREWVTVHPPGLYAVFFKASIESYGSALLAVDVGGVKELAELVRGNIDTFTMLMEAFAPTAFSRSFPGRHRVGEFQATISPTAGLSRVFAEVRSSQLGSSAASGPVGDAHPGESGDAWLAKVPRALVATAFSLLTPVLLSLVVLYCAAQMLLNDRSELIKREAVLSSEEQGLRNTERAAVVELQKENVELIRMFRTPPPSATP